MKQFIHTTPPDINELETKVVDGQRLYETPDGKLYPSVTTVLKDLSAAGIAAWRKKVGNEVANKVSAQASSRGTAVHKLCEDYINNEEDYLEGHMPANVETFNTLKGLIDKYLDNIVMQEVPLYSNYLEVGGRVDCIGEWNGKLSVIDFKTSKRRKRKDQISNYFMQASAYCVMFEELTKTPITQTIILMSVDNDHPLVFKSTRDEYIDQFVEQRSNYREKYGR
jgi:genome maintenance exonuclease 1